MPDKFPGFLGYGGIIAIHANWPNYPGGLGYISKATASPIMFTEEEADAFNTTKEPFGAQPTWDELGKPEITLIELPKATNIKARICSRAFFTLLCRNEREQRKKAAPLYRTGLNHSKNTNVCSTVFSKEYVSADRFQIDPFSAAVEIGRHGIPADMPDPFAFAA